MQEKVSEERCRFPWGDAVVLGHLLCDRVCHDDRDGVVCGRNVEQRDENANTELAALFSAEDFVNGTKQDSKAAVFPDQRAHRSDKNRNHTCLKHTRSAASHAGEHIPERRLSRTEHDNGTGSNTDKEYDKHLNARDAADQHEQVRTSAADGIRGRSVCPALSEGDYKDQRQRGKSSRESDPEVRGTVFISQPCPLQAAIVVRR